MTVHRVGGSIKRLLGLSTDAKPTDLPVGSTFFETDTGTLYIWDGGSWSVKI